MPGQARLSQAGLMLVTLTCWHTAVLQDAAMLCSICMLPRLLQLGTHCPVTTKSALFCARRLVIGDVNRWLGRITAAAALVTVLMLVRDSPQRAPLMRFKPALMTGLRQSSRSEDLLVAGATVGKSAGLDHSDNCCCGKRARRADDAFHKL